MNPNANLLDTELVLVLLARNPDVMLTVKQITQGIDYLRRDGREPYNVPICKRYVKRALVELYERGAIQCNSDANKFSL
jgi:hypothetical protein